MVNHSTDPSLRNTSLHKRELPSGGTEAADSANENGGTMASFFTLEAGSLPAAVQCNFLSFGYNLVPLVWISYIICFSRHDRSCVFMLVSSSSSDFLHMETTVMIRRYWKCLFEINACLQMRGHPCIQCGEKHASIVQFANQYSPIHVAADINSGEELLHTYGDLSDGDLLLTFGFVDTLGTSYQNPHNKVAHLQWNSMSMSRI